MSHSTVHNGEIRVALDELSDGIESVEPEAVWTAHHLHFALAMSEYDHAHLLEADRLYDLAKYLNHAETANRRWPELKQACEKRIAKIRE